MSSKQGRCPKCGAQLTMEDKSMTSEEVLQYCKCPSCKWAGAEVYALAYIGHLDNGTGDMLG